MELLFKHVVHPFHPDPFLVYLSGLEKVESVALIRAVVGGAPDVALGDQAAIPLASLTCHGDGREVTPCSKTHDFLQVDVR